MNSDKSVELKILKIILWVYIIFCFVIAGLNYGYASRANASVASFITWLWHFYENWVKTIFIIICSILTLRIVGKNKTTYMRKRNLIGFALAALVVHIVGPLLLHNRELYFFTMPLPWTTTPLQLLNSGSSFYQSRFPVWGAAGIATVLLVYVCVCGIVFIGTLLFGRRLQCSKLCLFNGFAAEVFTPAIPLVGKRKKVSPRTRKALYVLKWAFLSIAIILTAYWVLILKGVSLPVAMETVGKIETYKYLGTELLMTMFFWVAFLGRGYCYYCPLGTVLGLIGKVAGQKILTNNTDCSQCNQCNAACQMSIDIKKNAKNGKPITDLNCVGCGHCIDACPTKNLSYSTSFLSRLKSITASQIQPVSKEKEC